MTIGQGLNNAMNEDVCSQTREATGGEVGLLFLSNARFPPGWRAQSASESAGCGSHEQGRVWGGEVGLEDHPYVADSSASPNDPGRRLRHRKADPIPSRNPNSALLAGSRHTPSVNCLKVKIAGSWCSQVKGIKRKHEAQHNENVMKAPKIVKDVVKSTAAKSGKSEGSVTPTLILGKDNGFRMDENNKPMFRDFDLSELPLEAHPHPNRIHTGQHGYTVVSSNYAVTWNKLRTATEPESVLARLSRCSSGSEPSW